MHKGILAAATALVAVGCGTSVSAANLISNGSFESFTTQANGARTPLGYTISTTPTGPVSSPPVVIQYGDSSGYPTGPHGIAVPQDTFGPTALNSDTAGNYALYLSSDSSLETVGAPVSLAANTTYYYGFDYFLPAAGSVNPNDATLTGQFVVGNTVFNATSPISTATLTTGTWYQVSGSYTTGAAVSGTARLSFSSSGFPAKDLAVDRVYISAAVPEPASWAMMVGGFGLMGAAMRRKRASALFA